MEDQGQSYENKDHDGKYALIRDEEDVRWGLYGRPLPCFGFLTGFLFPLMWYYATVLYFSNYYRKDPRERAGLAASAIAVSLSHGCQLIGTECNVNHLQAINSHAVIAVIFYLNFAGIDLYSCSLHNSSCHSYLVQAISYYLDSSVDTTVVAGQKQVTENINYHSPCQSCILFQENSTLRADMFLDIALISLHLLPVSAYALLGYQFRASSHCVALLFDNSSLPESE
ncbi:putative 60S ribosomal protein L18a-like protein [Cocos nucifera]|uniref:Putative 60S ribosomal protein L18a-like protein n=1 Tax=Cocos nucifera TaxID=13894 RepID=A0A8K0IAI3_COCNU|nr:putative 60S ribosomal protein L18a-like protein [Cocos nucifera]